MGSAFSALFNRNYRLYALGSVFSNIGTWMHRVAQYWLVVVLAENDEFALGVTTGLQFLPMLLVTPYAGLTADRFPKRRLMQVTQLMMAVPALVLGVLAVCRVAEVWHVWVIAFLFGIGSAFDAPVRHSFVSEMVGADKVAGAVAINSVSFNAARIIGPGLAGLLIAVLGSGARATGWVIIANALSYGAVVLGLQLMRDSELHTPVRHPRQPGMIRDGFGYVRRHRDVMLTLTIVFFAGTFSLNSQITNAMMSVSVYGRGAGEYGLVSSTLAVGSLIGAFLAARRGRPTKRILVAGAFLCGTATMISGMMPNYNAFVIWSPLVGLTALTLMTTANSTVQLSVDGGYRGRVMAIYMLVFQGSTAIGGPFIGWVGQQFGARWTLIGGGAITLIGVSFALTLFSKPSRRKDVGDEVGASDRLDVRPEVPGASGAEPSAGSQR